MKQTINDWNPETRSLLNSLANAGAKLVSGDNGEEQFLFDGEAGENGFTCNGNLDKFIENLTACDEAALYVTVAGRERPLCISLVFGNSPGELASDYACHEILDNATDEHYDKWCDRKQPKKTGEYIDGKFVEDP